MRPLEIQSDIIRCVEIPQKEMQENHLGKLGTGQPNPTKVYKHASCS